MLESLDEEPDKTAKIACNWPMKEESEVTKKQTNSKVATEKVQQLMRNPDDEENKETIVRKANNYLLTEEEVESELFNLLEPYFRQRETLTTLNLNNKETCKGSMRNKQKRRLDESYLSLFTRELYRCGGSNRDQQEHRLDEPYHSQFSSQLYSRRRSMCNQREQ